MGMSRARQGPTGGEAQRPATPSQHADDAGPLHPDGATAGSCMGSAPISGNAGPPACLSGELSTWVTFAGWSRFTGPGHALGGLSSLAISLPYQVASQDRKHLLLQLPPRINTGHPYPVAARASGQLAAASGPPHPKHR